MLSVVLSKPRKASVISWIIRKVTKFPASHASIHFSSPDTLMGQPMVLEAVGSGARLVHGRIWDIHNERVATYRLVDKEDSGWKALNHMWFMLGLPYDYPGVLLFIGRLILGFFGLKPITISSPYALFCSELVARWITNIRADLKLPPSPLLAEETTPADLVGILSGMSMFKEVTCGSSLSATST